MTAPLDTARTAALRSIDIIANGDRPEFDEVVALGAVNHEGSNEPPACRAGGPEDFTQPRSGCALHSRT